MRKTRLFLVFNLVKDNNRRIVTKQGGVVVNSTRPLYNITGNFVAGKERDNPLTL